MVLVALITMSPFGFSWAIARAEAPSGECGRGSYGPCGAVVDGDFKVGVGRSEQRPGQANTAAPASLGNAAAGRLSATETTYEPTCGSNRPEQGGAVCPQALLACPGDGAIAFWTFTRTRDPSTGTVSAWRRTMQPAYACIGALAAATASRVPVSVPISALLAREFASLPLPRATLEVHPPDETLINVDTRFTTATTSQDLPPLTLLGQSVTVTAKAARYDWHFGDGSILANAGPGSPTNPITHVYRAAARVAPSVTITWSGTFRIAGDAATYPIIGTATTEGQPADLAVRTAHSVLVSR